MGFPSYRVTVAMCLMLVLSSLTAAFVGLTACDIAQAPFVIQGPGVADNVQPTLDILSPIADITVSRGQKFLIEWSDSDRDDNALINFSLMNAETNELISLVQNIQENDDLGPDQFSVNTDLIPEADYFLRGTISDGVNKPVVVFAQTQDTNPQRVLITVAPRGQGPPSTPPQVVVVDPAFNQSVAETDQIVIRVQPTRIPPNQQQGTPPFDQDSNATLFILLDTDDRPDNDDPANPDDSIIVLREVTVQQGQLDAIPFNVVVDLNEIPPRPDGNPYFIRATITDNVNPPVHAYASGTISVVSLAAGTVDLADIGRTLSGARFYGFNPGAFLGSSISGIGDFDGDGVDDLVLVAQFGNPRNFGLVGEAYLIYGQQNRRFGDAIAANSVSEAISGVIFEGPPIRTGAGDGRGIPFFDQARSRLSDGITDVSFLRDVTGDGRPEIMFGLAHVHSAFDSTDYDPADTSFSSGEPDAVSVRVFQGSAQAAINNGDFTNLDPFFYDGTGDLVVSSCAGGDCPNGRADVPNGALDLLYNNNGDADTQWILIKFADILDVLASVPAQPGEINIPDLTAQLSLRIFDPGGNADVFQDLTSFTEQTTFNTFAVNGGAPEPDVDYIATGLGGEGSAAFGPISAETASTVQVDVSRLVQDLLENNLLGANNELRFIIVPNSDFSDVTGIRASEFPTNEQLRPTLTIRFDRQRALGALGCYPDPLVNNTTNTVDRAADVQWFGGGMAVVVNSSNRDNRGPVNLARLDNTVVSLEMTGQDGAFFLTSNSFNRQSGQIFARADNARVEVAGNDPQIAGRIAGWRMVAGPYDAVDHRFTRPLPRDGLWGQSVASIGDMNQDGLDEIIISAPKNEAYVAGIDDPDSTMLASTEFFGSVVIIPGANYNGLFWRDKGDENDSTAQLPRLDQQIHPNGSGNFGACVPPARRHLDKPVDSFNIFAEDPEDELGDGQSAGDVNLDGVPDVLCGAPRNDRPGLTDSGSVYIIQGRNVFGDVRLSNADDPVSRPPMVRIRGLHDNDRIGHAQSTGLDINGDRLDDIFISSPFVDFEPVTRSTCAADFNGDNVVDINDLDALAFNTCRRDFGDEVFTDDACKAFDYDNDSDIDEEDQAVFTCLSTGGDDCCGGIVDNGYVGIIFGGITLDGDFDITQVGTPSLPGAVLFGGQALDRAGMNVSSAGDFNEDGFGDILITAPGRIITDPNGRRRKGVVYLVFGGTHLQNRTFDLDLVGTPELPGIVFFSPYVAGRPNEAAPDHLALLGDINSDGFDDIAIGNTRADFINLDFPQGPNAPVDDAGAGRRRDTGDVYIIYGNNFGTNRGR